MLRIARAVCCLPGDEVWATTTPDGFNSGKHAATQPFTIGHGVGSGGQIHFRRAGPEEIKRIPTTFRDVAEARAGRRVLSFVSPKNTIATRHHPELIVTCPTDQDVVTCSSIERVVSVTSFKGVPAPMAKQFIVPAQPLDEVRSNGTVQPIV